MLVLTLHSRSINLFKFFVRFTRKTSPAKDALLTWLKHLLCCYQNLITLLPEQNFALLQLLAKLQKLFLIMLQRDKNYIQKWIKSTSSTTWTGTSLLNKNEKKFVNKIWAGVGKSKLRDPIVAIWLDFRIMVGQWTNQEMKTTWKEQTL